METKTRFIIAQVEDRLRFQSTEGWLELKADNGRALVMGGTFDATVPEVFGGRIWHLLQAVMPELGLTVCQVSFPAANEWLQRIFVSAGFQKDGTFRSWDRNFQDVAVYSILASEVRYEVADGPTTIATADGTLDGEHAGIAAGNEPGSVQRDGPDDGVSGVGPGAGRPDEPDGSQVPATRAGDEATA